MRISGTEPSSLILSQSTLKSCKVMSRKCQKQAKAKRDGVIITERKSLH